ncbi:thioredoxin-interacting protein-like [Cololabis saira]|uniref:thioredoxin-interacting protein-like n=1 Tax=Cololabis saira TaxID=129043 RepID=UPI002AD45315|nr:thioredoxin-interacting protein-like [Cololabis saira]
MILSSGNKPRVFRLQLSAAGRSFYCSGDKLSGSVLLEADAPCRLAGLRVTAAGCARVEGRRRGHHWSREVEYLKFEEELRLEEELSADLDGCFLLPAGKSCSFKFGFELPAPGHLVSSYRGKFGSVRYYVRAELLRPSQHALHCEQEFEVEEPLDVNQPDLLAPAAGSRQKKVTCMFIPDGQVSITSQIDRKGFCEGEDISINAKFENSTSRIVVPKAAIVAQHSYTLEGKTKVWKQKLSSVRGNPIISGMCDMWAGRTIRVPRLKPTLRGCDIIQVDYFLLIYLHIPGSEKLTLELPLVIGTVPFMGSRTSSVSSRVGGGSTCSWASFLSAPPSYGNIAQDLGVGGPCTPLLHDYDGQDNDDEDRGLFMTAPEGGFPGGYQPGYQPAPGGYPPPPAYAETDPDYVQPAPAVQVF